MGPPWRIDPTTHCTMSERSYHGSKYGSCHDDSFKIKSPLVFAVSDTEMIVLFSSTTQ